ncbi:MAG TPA: diguanylate cyclase [Burkholderiaceae bacterium]|nr:diguanylate cyclase [Burkholderiaceae bacterium]
MTDTTPSAPAPRSSLVRRLTRMNLLVLSVTMLLTFVLLATATWWVARARQMQSAQLSAQLLANSVAPMLVFADADAARNELAAFSRRSDLLLVQVLDERGGLFVQWQADGQPPEGAARVPAGLAAFDARGAADASTLEVWAPVRLKGEMVGALLLRESLQSLHRAVLLLTGVAALLIAAAIGIAARGLSVVQRRALAPLVELSDLAERVAQDQDYSRRAAVRRPDEVGRLTERFNDMLRRVQISQADLRHKLVQEQEAGQQLHQMAHQDSLTELPNRLFFQGELQRCLAVNAERGELMALMFIDLDNFKTVNDQQGHDAGDAVLREVARRMSDVVRADDVLCRLGGDEFALILPALPDEQAAEQLALRLIEAVRAPLLIDGKVMPVGATVGLAFSPLDAREAGELLNASDQAMYAAKRAGKNTYRRARDAHV